MDKWHQNSVSDDLWEKINHAFETGQVIKGLVKDAIKGGFIADFLGIDAFLPGSLIDAKPVNDFDSYLGTWLDLIIVSINELERNIVVSHRTIIERELELQKIELLKKMRRGQILEGTVKNLSPLGAFIDLGIIDGLVRIPDVSWRRIKHPEEELEFGQKVNVIVLDFDVDSQRISLGIKQLALNPWGILPTDIKQGSIVKGKVVNFLDYGCFIEIYPGIEGLLHVLEMSWSTHSRNPHEYLNLGDKIDVIVLNIDRDGHKLSLGLKQLTRDPWADLEMRYAVGSKHIATVRLVTNFGLFVEFESGLDGLVHVSDLSWTRKCEPAEFISAGEKINVVVLDFEKGKRRLSLGVKQLNEDPWDALSAILIKGSEHKGIIDRVDKDQRIVVRLTSGVETYVHKKCLLKADGMIAVIGETLDFRVIEFEKAIHLVTLSHTATWWRKKKMMTKENKESLLQKKKGKVIYKNTLGFELDILEKLRHQLQLDEGQEESPGIQKLPQIKVIVEAKPASNEPQIFIPDSPESKDPETNFPITNSDKNLIPERFPEEHHVSQQWNKDIPDDIWNEITSAWEMGLIVQGYVKVRVGGGLAVDIMGMSAFLPGSQIEDKPVEDFEPYIHTWLDLKVTKVNKLKRKIIVSHKAVFENNPTPPTIAIFKKIEIGQIVEGVVTNISPFGAFVNIGGVFGLVHISNMSWGRVHPKEILEMGQLVNVVILAFDPENYHISLGMKQLVPDPWEAMNKDIKEGSVLKGKVIDKTDYGLYFEIEKGIEGFVHRSEISWTINWKYQYEYIKIGYESDVKVLHIDYPNHTILLSLKRLSADPRPTIGKDYLVGSKHSVTVCSISDHGFFVKFASGIDGLVSNSNLSWVRKYHHPSKFAKKGETIKVIVLELDQDKKKLRIGVKQLKEDPWDILAKIFFEGSTHQGRIRYIDGIGAAITLEYDVEAYASLKYLVKADACLPEAGETLNFKVKELNREKHSIILSHSETWTTRTISHHVNDYKAAKQIKAMAVMEEYLKKYE